MNLRLDEADIAALRVRARLEDVSVQAVVQVAIREYTERHRRAERVDSVLDR